MEFQDFYLKVPKTGDNLQLINIYHNNALAATISEETIVTSWQVSS